MKSERQDTNPAFWATHNNTKEASAGKTVAAGSAQAAVLSFPAGEQAIPRPTREAVTLLELFSRAERTISYALMILLFASGITFSAWGTSEKIVARDLKTRAEHTRIHVGILQQRLEHLKQTPFEGEESQAVLIPLDCSSTVYIPLVERK